MSYTDKLVCGRDTTVLQYHDEHSRGYDPEFLITILDFLVHGNPCELGLVRWLNLIKSSGELALHPHISDYVV